MDNRQAVFFLMGWHDRLDNRLQHMAAYDRALNSERRTTTVRTMGASCWGMI